MRRRRGCIFIVLGLILAIGTGALVFRLLQESAAVSAAATMAAAPALPTPTPLPTKSIPVAARELAVGSTLTTTDIIQREYPDDLLPVGVMTDTSKIVGQLVIEGIQPGEFFRESQFRSGE